MAHAQAAQMQERQIMGALLHTLLGGLGTVFGPVTGAFLIVAMENYFSAFGQWVLVIQGAIFVLCVLLFRRGIVGELANVLRIKL